MASLPNGSPVEYPILILDGVEYQIRFGLGALYRLEKAGISVDQIDSASVLAGGKPLHTILTLLSFTLGRENDDGTWETIGYTAEQLADIFDRPANRVTLQELTEKIASAQAKASPAGSDSSQTSPAIQ
jgi:hypothetical protein